MKFKFHEHFSSTGSGMSCGGRFRVNLTGKLSRTVLGFIVANLFCVVPILLWLLWPSPVRLEINVRAEHGAVAKIYTCGQEGLELKRMVAVSGSGGAQTLKAYFSDPIDLQKLAVSIVSDGVMELKSLALLQHGLFRQMITAADFEKAYPIKDGVHMPSENASCSWRWEMSTDRRIAWAICTGETLLLLVCVIFAFQVFGLSRKEIVLSSCSVAFVTSFLFCFAVPLQSYLANRSLFDFSLFDFCGEAIGLFVAVSVFIGVALFLLARCFGLFVHVALLSIVFYEYLETGILAIGLPSLNGELAFFADSCRQTVDSLVAMAIVMVFLVSFKWIKHHLEVVALAIFVLSSASLVDVKVENRQVATEAMVRDFSSKFDVAKNAVYSIKRNVMVFIVDSMTVDAAAAVLGRDPALRAQYAGFTSYTNNVGMGPYTNTALPGLMTGLFADEYQGEDYVGAIFSRESMIAPYIEADAHVSFIPGLFTYGYSTAPIPRVRNAGGETPFSRRTGDLLNLDLHSIVRFRLMPFKFKRWLLTMLFMSSDSHASVDAERTLYPILATRPSTNSMDVTLHVYHTRGTHPPVCVDENGVSLPSGSRDTFRGMCGQAHYVLKKLGVLFDVYRDRGLYDRSTIIVCGDHGCEISKNPMTSESGPSSRAYPVLMVKPEGSKDPYGCSSLPTSHVKIAALVKQSLTRSLTKKEISTGLTTRNRLYYERGRKFCLP